MELIDAGLRQFGLKRDLVTLADDACLHHCRVESAAGPAGRRHIAGPYLRVVYFMPKMRPVDIQGSARRPDFGQLDDSRSDTKALPRTQQKSVQAPGSEVFAHGAVVHRITASRQIVDAFGRYEKHGLTRAAVNFGMCVCVPFKA